MVAATRFWALRVTPVALPARMDLSSSLQMISAAAVEAGLAIMRIRRSSDLGQQQKSDHSPVTAADHAADAILCAALSTLPGTLVTEESCGPHAPTSGWVWWVDPLDGTRDFIDGRDDFVVQIGAVLDGVPMLGVIHHPPTSTTWRAWVPDGIVEVVDAAGVRVLPRVTAYNRTQPRVTMSISHPSMQTTRMVQAVQGQALMRGSVGLKVAAILQDEADAYLSASLGLHGWDTAGPAAIALAAGMRVTDVRGAGLQYGPSLRHEHGCIIARPGMNEVCAVATATLANEPLTR
jgi:3'(2'), 5'-bisphosphate nucleotidase